MHHIMFDITCMVNEEWMNGELIMGTASMASILAAQRGRSLVSLRCSDDQEHSSPRCAYRVLELPKCQPYPCLYVAAAVCGYMALSSMH